MKFVTIVGARPQFVKAAAVSQELRKEHTEILIHTGQHYDMAMSDIFFQELGIPSPDINLQIGSGLQGAQTGAMLGAIETVLVEQKPDIVIVYGDTNSTLAGALAASKLHIPIAHIEAGLRSFNRAMPEEVNRVLTDHISTWLFAPSDTSRHNLAAEGITKGIHVVGDIMLDSVNLFRLRASHLSKLPEKLGYTSRDYCLCTVHRAENTDDAGTLHKIFSALDALPKPVIIPLHPRTRKAFETFDIRPGKNITIIDPVGYLDMLCLQENAACILTDSGGVQKEAYYLGVPCVTLREETEWVEIVESGWNIVAGSAPLTILSAFDRLSQPLPERKPIYGSGDTAKQIVSILPSPR